MSSSPFELESFLVRAGAGAGKTTGLVSRVFEVYEGFNRTQGRNPRIVLTTFTRKATQEIKERLIKKACDDRDSNFLKFVSDPSALQISTIHGILSIFLQQCGHLAELDSGFTLISEGDGYQQARLALREALIEHPDGLRWFDIYGFERVLRMCRLFDRYNQEFENIRPANESDLLKIAEVERQRWTKELNKFINSTLSTYEDPKVQKFAEDLKSFVSAWTGEDLEGLPRKPARSDKKPDLNSWHEEAGELLEGLRKVFKKPGWSRKTWPEMARHWAEFQSLAEVFAKKLNEIKWRTGQYEIADLELLSAKILRQHPVLADMFAEQWDYWMIDEYQDTSPLQVNCLAALVNGRPKYVVGDPQQSIYLFRGAEVGVFAQAEEEMREAGAKMRSLFRNYRSKPHVLNFINEFMHSVDTSFHAMETDTVINKSEPACAMLRARDDDHELDMVVARVSELVSSGAKLQEICILGRTHDHLRDVAVALKKFGYPTYMHSATGFMQRREVMDAQALWTFLINPHDTVNLVALLRSPWFFVTDAFLENSLKNKPDSLWRHLLHLPEQDLPAAIGRLMQIQQSVREIGVVQTFEKTLNSACYLDLSLHNDPAGRKESNLWKMISKARELESESSRSLLDLSGQKELIFDVLEVTEGDATSAQEPNCIQLMTIHGAKGLEFDHVIIPRMGKRPPPQRSQDLTCMDGKFFFPLRDEENSDTTASVLDMVWLEQQRLKEDQESLRALYVAVTRARSSLTLSWSQREAHSWALRSSWFTWESGEHLRDHFCVRVCEEMQKPQNFIPSEKTTGQVRTPWQSETVKTVDQFSVTSLVNKVAKRPSVSVTARMYGQKIHRRLEGLKYRAGTVATQDPVENFVLNLNDPPMQKLITEGYVEWGFQVQTPKGVIEGQIDAWGKVDSQIYVIDYKSGSTDYIDKAFDQLSLYAWALRRFGHKEDVAMVVIYPLSQKVEKKVFTQDLFLRWENEFGVTQAAR